MADALHESFHEERIRTTSDALAALPRIVTEAMRIAELSGRDGPDKRQMVIDWVSDFFSKRSNVGSDSDGVVALGVDVLGSLVPAMIDQLIGVENGKVVIAKDKRCCLSCCSFMGHALKANRNIQTATQLAAALRK